MRGFVIALRVGAVSCYNIGMKRKCRSLIVMLIAAAVCVSSLFGLGACSPNLQPMQFETTRYFGTLTRVVTFGNFNDTKESERARALWATIDDTLNEIDRAVNPEIASSDLARWNALTVQNGESERLQVSKITYDILCLARQVYEATQGAYNPAVGTSVDLWGFTPRFLQADYVPSKAYDRADPTKELPADKYVQAFRSLARFDSVRTITETIDGSEVYYVTKPDVSVTVDGVAYAMTLDLGGIAKGYAADRVRDLLEQAGVSYGYVSVGTSSIALLKSPQRFAGSRVKEDWSVGIKDPFDPTREYLNAYAHDAGLSTSGDYERYYEIDGVRYCHMIDARTGRPITGDLHTVSVFAPQAAYADALSTALAVMGSQAALQWLGSGDRKAAVAMLGGDASDRKFTTFDGEYASFRLKK